MQATYQATIDRIIQKYEGGYGWDKGDRGGPTKYGITCYDLAEHRGKPMTSMSTWAPLVQAMTLAEAEDIYRTKYATGLRYNDLPAGVDACMLDYAINSGVSRPIIVAAKLLGVSARVLTDEFVAAIKKADPKWLIDAMCQERLAFMHGIRGGTDWNEFGHGWQARVNDVEQYSDALTGGAVPAPVLPSEKSPYKTPKAQHGDPHAGKKTVAVTTTGPVASSIAHAAGAPPWVAIGIFVAVCAGAVAWFYWQQARNAKANATVNLPFTIPPQPPVKA